MKLSLEIRLKGFFEAEGYDVFEAENGVEMHHILANHNINLVVMDINLPGKTAYYWQENSVKNCLPLIFLTGRYKHETNPYPNPTLQKLTPATYIGAAVELVEKLS